MNQYVSLKGFDFDKAETYEELTRIITNFPDGKVLEVGEDVEGNTIYGLTYGDIENKPVILIDGVIHGLHEWTCAHIVHKFMEIIANPDDLPIKSIIHNLRSKYSFVAVPCLNIHGYLNNDYYNVNGVDLNRNFDADWHEFESNRKGSEPFSEPEARVVRDLIATHKPLMYVNLHTWGGYENGIIQGEQSGRAYSVTMRSTKQLYENSTKAFIQHNFGLLAPRSVEWAGRQNSKHGSNTFGVTLEHGSLESNNKQAEISLNVLISLLINLE